MADQSDEAHMARALALAAGVRGATAPNPWVGCVVVSPDGRVHEGATEPPGGPHAEVVALDAPAPAPPAAPSTPPSSPAPTTAARLRASTPCSPPGWPGWSSACSTPTRRCPGAGSTRLRQAGVEVTVGVGADEVAEQLAPYLKHRRTGRPWVVLKLAATLDGRTAAPDGTSRWITGADARADVHRLRARSDAVLVGAGTVRADDPELTARLDPAPARQPLRVVLGRAPEEARVRPAVELSGDLGDVLDDLGARGVLQLLVEGGARVAHDFHAAGLVDRYVLYLAPALLGGDDGVPLFSGPGAATIADLWRGRLVSVDRLGQDLRLEVAA